MGHNSATVHHICLGLLTPPMQSSTRNPTCPWHPFLLNHSWALDSTSPALWAPLMQQSTTFPAAPQFFAEVTRGHRCNPMIGHYPTLLMCHTSTHYAYPTTLLPGTVGLVAIPSTRQHSHSMASQMSSASMSCPHSPMTKHLTSAAGKSHATKATNKN